MLNPVKGLHKIYKTGQEMAVVDYIVLVIGINDGC